MKQQWKDYLKELRSYRKAKAKEWVAYEVAVDKYIKGFNPAGINEDDPPKPPIENPPPPPNP